MRTSSARRQLKLSSAVLRIELKRLQVVVGRMSKNESLDAETDEVLFCMARIAEARAAILDRVQAIDEKQ